MSEAEKAEVKMKKVTLELHPAFYRHIENLIVKNPQLGFESTEKFMEEALRLYVQELLSFYKA